MENLRNRVDIRLVNNEKYYLKQTSKPTFITQKIFGNDLVAIHKIKITLILQTPAYFAMCALEINKVPIYEFPYENIINIKNKYDSIISKKKKKKEKRKKKKYIYIYIYIYMYIWQQIEIIIHRC